MHSLGGRQCEILARVNGDIILSAAEGGSRSDYFDAKARADFDSTLSEDVVAKTVKAAIELLPGLKNAELIEHRGDLAAYAPGPAHVKPIVGRLPGWENGYFVTAGGLGIQLSVGLGEVMADLIVDGQVPFRARHMMEHLSP